MDGDRHGDGPPAATLMPILWRGDRLVAHMAKANQHWRAITDGMPALVIVTGPEAYISPSWYASKAEHGRVVPTWNYLAVHLTGTVFVRRDPAWLLASVTDLTDRHEHDRIEPWHAHRRARRVHHRTTPSDHRHRDARRTRRREGEAQPEPLRRGSTRSRRGLEHDAGAATGDTSTVLDAMRATLTLR